MKRRCIGLIATSEEDSPFPYILLGGCLSRLDRLVDFKGTVFFYSAEEDLYDFSFENGQKLSVDGRKKTSFYELTKPYLINYHNRTTYEKRAKKLINITSWITDQFTV